MESGEINSHELLIFCGPYAHIGIYDSWLSDCLTANIFFPFFISKCAINLETTASGRRIKASHRSCIIISVIVSCCCRTCCCKAEKDFHTFPLPFKCPFYWGWEKTSKLNMPQNYGSTESVKVPTAPKLSFPGFILPLPMFPFFFFSTKFWKDFNELYLQPLSSLSIYICFQLPTWNQYWEVSWESLIPYITPSLLNTTFFFVIYYFNHWYHHLSTKPKVKF